MLHVHFLPALTSPEELAGGSVLVIDVLRASTTITHALANGAAEVIPCLEVDEARQIAAELTVGTAVLGGERGGLPIEGFHFGNSPIDYTRRKVEGKTVVFTTTNGTKAMMHCRLAAQVIIGSFVNLSAVHRSLTESDQVHLLCAGTGGRITREDVLFAGALVARAIQHGRADHELNDSARLAADAWAAVERLQTEQTDSSPVAAVATALKRTQGGRNLKALGLEGDLDTAAQIDRFDLVPTLDLSGWRIRAT